MSVNSEVYEYLQYLETNLTYKPGWSFYTNIRDRIFGIVYETYDVYPSGSFVNFRQEIPFSSFLDWNGLFDPGYIRDLIFHFVAYIEGHELYEFFRIEGEPYFPPHMGPDKFFSNYGPEKVGYTFTPEFALRRIER